MNPGRSSKVISVNEASASLVGKPLHGKPKPVVPSYISTYSPNHTTCRIVKPIRCAEEARELHSFHYACLPSRTNISKLYKSSFPLLCSEGFFSDQFLWIVFLHHYTFLGANKLNVKRDVAHLPFYSWSGVISKWRVYNVVYWLTLGMRLNNAPGTLCLRTYYLDF